jgi:hypothetical protein
MNFKKGVIMGTPLGIESKSDYTAGSSGKLFAGEFMTMLDNINTSIDKIPGWENIDSDKRLLFALSSALHINGFTVGGDENDITLTSNGYERLLLKDKDTVSFVTPLSNTDEVTLTIDSLRSRPLVTDDGIVLTSGFLKENHMQYAVYDEENDVFRLINTNADASMVEEKLEEVKESLEYLILDNRLTAGMNDNNIIDRVNALTNLVHSMETKIEELFEKNTILEDAVSKQLVNNDGTIETYDGIKLVSGDFAGVEGPTEYVKRYVSKWGGSTFTTNTRLFTIKENGIQVNHDGYYRVHMRQRVNSNGENGYVTISIDGDRRKLEDREDGLWTHDHSDYVNNFTSSIYIGKLYNGELICGGFNEAEDGIYSDAGYVGMLTVERIK